MVNIRHTFGFNSKMVYYFQNERPTSISFPNQVYDTTTIKPIGLDYSKPNIQNTKIKCRCVKGVAFIQSPFSLGDTDEYCFVESIYCNLSFKQHHCPNHSPNKNQE